MKIILADASVITVDSITLEPHLAVSCPDRGAFLSIWDRLTPQNLDHVEVYRDDAFVAAFDACELIGTQTIIKYDGSMIAHFYLSGDPAPKIDPAFEQAYAIITGETV